MNFFRDFYIPNRRNTKLRVYLTVYTNTILLSSINFLALIALKLALKKMFVVYYKLLGFMQDASL